MTSATSFKDRILRACKVFMEEDQSRYKQNRDKAFYAKFDKYMENSNVTDSLLRRGCQDDLRSQWTQRKNTEPRKLHKLLQNNEAQRISVNNLIDQMREADTPLSNYDFEMSCQEIKDVKKDLEAYVLNESRAQLKKILDYPRFYEHFESYCQAFTSESERQKGLITRVKETQPTYLVMDGCESTAREQAQAKLNRRLRKCLTALKEEDYSLMLELLMEAALNDDRFDKDFYFSEKTWQTQKFCQLLPAEISKRMESVAAVLAVGIVSHQLEYVLQACETLYQYSSRGDKKYEHSKEAVEIGPLLKFLNTKLPLNIDNAPADPDFTKEIIEKTLKDRKFYGAAQMVTGDLEKEVPWCAMNDISKYHTEEEMPEQVKNSLNNPTASENLFVLVRFLRRYALKVKYENGKNDNVKFFRKNMVIDQSVNFYQTLLKLVKEAKKTLEEQVEGKASLLNEIQNTRSRDLAFYCFDGLLDILANNLQALFEGEHASLQAVFQIHSKSSDEIRTILQEHYYPDLLRTLFWRAKFGKKNDYDPVADLSKWQKLIPFEDVDLFKKMYSESGLENQENLFKQHLQYIPSLVQFVEDLPKILESLDIIAKNENFDKLLENAQDFLRMAVQQQSPAAGALIREVFKRAISDTENKDNTISDRLSEQIKAMLFMASDNRQSKIAIVLKDVLSGGASFEDNPFTQSIMRMIVADSVNILNNMTEVEISSEKEKMTKLPWKPLVLHQNLHGGDAGHKHFVDFPTIQDAASDFTLPEIVEIGLWYESFVNGVSIFYRDGTSYERKGDSNPGTYTGLKLVKGEYVSLVHGRFGSWSDQLTICTNMGRTLRAGGNGGGEQNPVYPPRTCVIGLDTHFHNHLTRVEVHYVNLDQIPQTSKDPLLSLICESDLLSKGIEQKYLQTFSKNVIQEITNLQDLIGKPILEQTNSKSTNLGISSSAIVHANDEEAAKNLIDNDIHMQIIHFGKNEALDDFMQVLQMLLKESNEPIRPHMNIMQDNGLIATRACFAVIIKLSGLTSKLEYVLENLEIQAMDFEADEPGERLKNMKEAAKKLKKETPLLFNEWCNATKMRKWLKDQVFSTGQQLTVEQEDEAISKLLDGIVTKAEFLVKLQRPHFFQSLDPKQELFELSYRIPSFARDYRKDETEVKADIEEQTLWRQSYKEWKTNLKQTGTIRSQQQKKSEVRQIGTAAILVCLQQTQISKETLQTIVEKNFLNSCYRLVGLQLLEFVVDLFNMSLGKKEASKRDISMMRIVAAALNQGIRKDNFYRCHYLDGIKSCGDHLQSLIRSTFFNVVRSISDTFVYADQIFLMELLSCLDWSFKARDFENLIDLKVFKLLHTGVAIKVTTEEGEVKNKNIILQKWKTSPFEPLTMELKILSSDLYMSIVSRLAEPEAREIIFKKEEQNVTGIGSLLRKQSALNVNATQSLLAEAFNIMFREFHEFTLVGDKIGPSLSFNFLSQFDANSESIQWAEGKMAQLHNDLMQKIIENQPFVDPDYIQQKTAAPIIEESKTTSPEEVIVLIETNKPKTKTYDSLRYSSAQIEVLEALDNNVQLTAAQRAIHEDILALAEEDMLGGMFNMEDDGADQQEEVQVLIKKISKDDKRVPFLRQKIVQTYRNFQERSNIKRYLQLVLIFVRIATKAPYPLEMLQNVANPYHIKILLQLLFFVSVECKLQILTIFQTLLRIQVPLSVFDESTKDLKVNFRTQSKVQFKSSFAKFFFLAALQIQSNTWDSAFREFARSGMYDVSVQLTRTVALCLKIQDQREKHNEDLSTAFMQMVDSQLSETEVFCLMQIMQATCSMPVCGDTILFSEKAQKNDAPETAITINFDNMHEVFKNSSFSKGCQVVPDFVPDSQIPLVLSQEALQSLTKYLGNLSALMKTCKTDLTLKTAFIIKLLLLQNSENGLEKLPKDSRVQLIRTLSKISAFSSEEEKEFDETLYITSLVETALAIHLRDQIETILPSEIADVVEDEPIDMIELVEPVINFNWHFLDLSQSIDQQISSIPANFLEEIKFERVIPVAASRSHPGCEITQRPSDHAGSYNCDKIVGATRCLSGLTGFYQSRGIDAWTCPRCNWDLCIKCMKADKYLMMNPEKIIEKKQLEEKQAAKSQAALELREKKLKEKKLKEKTLQKENLPGSKPLSKQSTLKKKHSAAEKYSKQLLSKAKQNQGDLKKELSINVTNNLIKNISTLAKDSFASVPQIIEMEAAVVEYCRFSGCSLLEVLYGINENLDETKKFFTTESIIDMYNEQLVAIAENENPRKDEVLEKQFVEQVTKKIEKIISLMKPETFKTEVLGKINLAVVIEEVEAKTHGMSNLMRTRVQDRLFDQESVFKDFSLTLGAFAGSEDQQFNEEVKRELEESTKGSNWPIFNWPLDDSKILDENEVVKAAQILAKRFAEKLLFDIFDPSIDTIGKPEQEDTRDIADIIAGVPINASSLAHCYSHVFGEIQEGLRSYSKTVKILKASNGVECIWEAKFAENFKVESKLSKDFDSLRKLDDQAVNSSMLQSKNMGTLVSKAEKMLSQTLLQEFQSTPELQSQSQKFLVYLLKCVISNTFDDLSSKLEDKPRYMSSLVDALSKDRIKQASTEELVERVKLITYSVLKSRKTILIGTFGPDLFSLTIYCMLLKKTLLYQKRLLLDQAFQIVHAFDSKDLKEFVQMGAWEKIAQNRVMRRTIEAITKRNSFVTDSSSLLHILSVDLQGKISKIDIKASAFSTESAAIEMESTAKAALTWFKSNITDKLANSNIRNRLQHEFLQDLKKKDIIKRDFSVTLNNSDTEDIIWSTLDLGFADGSQTQFRIEPLSEDSNQELADLEFEVRYYSGKQAESELKFFADSLPSQVEINSNKLKISCTARKRISNISVVDEGAKFRHVNGKVRQVLPSLDRKSIYVVTDTTIYMVTDTTIHENLNDKILDEDRVKKIELPEDFKPQDHLISRISIFGDHTIFETDKGVFSKTKEECVVKKIGDHEVISFIMLDNVAAFVTRDGKLHNQGLIDKLGSVSVQKSIDMLVELDMPTRLVGYTEADLIVNCQLGGSGEKKYCYLSVLRNGNKLLFSKGYNEFNILGRSSTAEPDKFFMVLGQSNTTSFEKLFLFNTVAFAVDQKGKLWILGGKMALNDESIFPKSFGYDHFNMPTKTKLLEVAQKRLALDESSLLRTKNVIYSAKMILITIEQISAAGGLAEEIQIVLKDNGEGKWDLTRVYLNNPFIFEDKLWHVEKESEDAKEHLNPKAVLKVTAKPLVYNLENVTNEILVKLTDSDHLILGQLQAIEKLSKNQELASKVYRAMNNLIRLNYKENGAPSNDKLREIVNDALNQQESREYNPLKCWNEQDREEDVRALVNAILEINVDFNILENQALKKTRDSLLKDPLINDSLQKLRLDESASSPSLFLGLEFLEANFVILSKMQDTLYNQAPKASKCNQSRIEVDFHRFKASQYALDGKVDKGDGDTLFTQMFRGLEKEKGNVYETWFRREGDDDRFVRANFKGEGSIDAGGPYRELMENISRELCSSVLPILIPTENQRHEHGYMRECFVLNHQANTKEELKMMRQFGLIIGFAIRSCQTWNMALHPIVWKAIAGVPLDLDEDLKTSDKFMHQMFEHMREQAKIDQSESDFSQSIENQCFTLDLGNGETDLCPGGASRIVTRENLEEYISLASKRILTKAAIQMEHFLSGVYFVADKSACQFLSWRNAEVRAMGESFIDMGILRKYTHDESGNSEKVINWFWEVLNEMSEDDKQKYLKFVNGRAKLPTDPTQSRQHKIARGRGGDGAMPQSHTCFFTIDLPQYTQKEILRQRLLTAIRFCGEIDTDG